MREITPHRRLTEKWPQFAVDFGLIWAETAQMKRLGARCEVGRHRVVLAHGRAGEKPDHYLRRAPGDDTRSPLREASFKPGDTLKVEAEGVSRVVLTRVDELIDRHSGCLDTSGAPRERLDVLRKEWR